MTRRAPRDITVAPLAARDTDAPASTNVNAVLGFEENDVASDPANATRVATMAARLRQLSRNWPVDADPNGPDPEEDE